MDLSAPSVDREPATLSDRRLAGSCLCLLGKPLAGDPHDPGIPHTCHAKSDSRSARPRTYRFYRHSHRHSSGSRARLALFPRRSGLYIATECSQRNRRLGRIEQGAHRDAGYFVAGSPPGRGPFGPKLSAIAFHKIWALKKKVCSKSRSNPNQVVTATWT